ncbi:hypothetical protein M1D80_11055 [Phyllobacteriaceae bacterium JZ32]
MTATAPTMDGTSVTDSPTLGRGLTAGIIDRRTKEWRRRCELVAIYSEALGGANAISPVLMSKIEAAAELAVIAEKTRADFLRGDGATADDVVRTARLAATAEKALGIDARNKAKAKRPNPVAEYVAGRSAA